MQQTSLAALLKGGSGSAVSCGSLSAAHQARRTRSETISRHIGRNQIFWINTSAISPLVEKSKLDEGHGGFFVPMLLLGASSDNQE